MADEPRIISARTREPTEAEIALFDWLAEQQKDPPKPLEEGARQLISLVTALYGVIFGILTLAGDPLPAYLAWPAVRALGAIAVLAYLAAMIAALVVVLPDDYRYARASKQQAEAVLARLLRRKFWGLRVAVWAFALGTIAFAALFLIVLLG